MMEGVASEAASLAGHLKLGNLCWIYDNNRITIEGHTDLAFSDDVAARFRAYGWNVQHVGDANDTERIAEAFDAFRRDHDAPTLIIVDSHIGYGSPHKQDTSAAHGEPLGEEEVRLAKRAYGWPEDAQFPGSGRRARTFRDEHWRARRAAAAELAGRACEPIAQNIRTWPTRARADAAARASRWMGRRPADFPRRRQGHRQPRFLRKVLNAIARASIPG